MGRVKSSKKMKKIQSINNVSIMTPASKVNCVIENGRTMRRSKTPPQALRRMRQSRRERGEAEANYLLSMLSLSHDLGQDGQKNSNKNESIITRLVKPSTYFLSPLIRKQIPQGFQTNKGYSHSNVLSAEAQNRIEAFEKS